MNSMMDMISHRMVEEMKRRSEKKKNLLSPIQHYIETMIRLADEHEAEVIVSKITSPAMTGEATSFDKAYARFCKAVEALAGELGDPMELIETPALVAKKPKRKIAAVTSKAQAKPSVEQEDEEEGEEEEEGEGE
jgi:hypothetical protein